MADSIIGGAMNPNRQKVTQKYKDMFGREGDEEGINYWTNYLSSGKSDNDFNSAFKGASIDTYNNYLTDANSKQATDKNISGVLAGDFKSGVTAGGGTGATEQDILRNSLNKPIYDNLYGSPTSSGQTLAQSPVYNQTAATYTPTLLGSPTTWNVTPEQTVEGRINSLTDPNSPIIQMARTRALEQQNANGTLNSSLAITAGQKAAYDAAIPIATADAGTFAKAAGYNADEKNQFSVRNQDATNSSGQFNANANNTLLGQKLAADTGIQQSTISSNTALGQTQMTTNTQKSIAELDAITKTNMAQLDANTKGQLAQIDSSTRQLLQTNQSAANFFSTITQNITNISASKDMDAAAKQAAVDNQIQLLQNGLGIIGKISNLNLTDLLNFANNAATAAIKG